MSSSSKWLLPRAPPERKPLDVHLEPSSPAPDNSLPTSQWEPMFPETNDFNWASAFMGEHLIRLEERHSIPEYNSMCESIVEAGDLEVKTGCRAGGGPSWGLSTAPSVLNRTPYYNNSDAGTEISPQSPNSLFSEFPDRESPYSRTIVGQSTQGRMWDHHLATYQTYSLPRVYDGSVTMQTIAKAQPYDDHTAIVLEMPGVLYNGSAVSTPSIGQSQAFGYADHDHKPSFMIEQNISAMPGRPYLQTNFEDSTPSWRPFDHSQDYAPLHRHVPEENDSFGVKSWASNSSTFVEDASNNTEASPVEYQGEHYMLLDRPADLGQISKADFERRSEDAILLEGKRAGLTYKEIRKMLTSKVAESTLRGRYRSLTKPRRERVRSPKWTLKDVQLLREVVQRELDRLDDVCYRNSTREQKLTKLSWKRVADYITDHGGTYHFGNSTCKKKWMALESGR